MFKWSSDQFNSQDANHVISHASFSLVNRFTADVYRYDGHNYVNIHITQTSVVHLHSAVKSIMDDR